MCHVSVVEIVRHDTEDNLCKTTRGICKSRLISTMTAPVKRFLVVVSPRSYMIKVTYKSCFLGSYNHMDLIMHSF